jgi:hypothetical protein
MTAAWARFERRPGDAPTAFSVIGEGEPGGKAAGLFAAEAELRAHAAELHFPGLTVDVPRLTVLATGVFERFLDSADLRAFVDGHESATADLSAEAADRRLAVAFQRGVLPADVVGDLWALAGASRAPLAVRSSSRLEDALRHPFAGVYATKMVPSADADPQRRFRSLLEAVRFVYASTFFRSARAYLRAAGCASEDERMAVVIQEVVGEPHGPRYYPDVAGVARSYNFYPVGAAQPDEGVVDLALGLGKTVVDGGRTWTYSPAHPRARPPFASAAETAKLTQSDFWAVRLVPGPWDPADENEHLVRAGLREAEADGTLGASASTYDAARDRLVPGLASTGPRVLDFAPLLSWGEPPLNDALRALLGVFAARAGAPVEIEFALTWARAGRPARLGFLQVREMAVARGDATLRPDDLAAPEVVVASERVMGHGLRTGLEDVVFIDPERFELARTSAIAVEVERCNRTLIESGRPYVLIGFGRWGSSDPWLGVPVTWPQIAGAAVIVEATTSSLRAEPSQGAHFFHNLLGFHVAYLSVPEDGRLDWDYLRSLPRVSSGTHVVHARVPGGLVAEIDGRHRLGRVRRATTLAT